MVQPDSLLRPLVLAQAYSLMLLAQAGLGTRESLSVYHRYLRVTYDWPPGRGRRPGGVAAMMIGMEGKCLGDWGGGSPLFGGVGRLRRRLVQVSRERSEGAEAIETGLAAAAVGLGRPGSEPAICKSLEFASQIFNSFAAPSQHVNQC